MENILETYIVKLSVKDNNGDCQLLNIEVKCNDEDLAIEKAINYYYETYWSNSEWRKDEFDKEMEDFVNNLQILSKKTMLKNIPNFSMVVNEYKSKLRISLGATDKSFQEFSNLSITSKADYLLDIGCDLSYFVYNKKYKFENVSI